MRRRGITLERRPRRFLHRPPAAADLSKSRVGGRESAVPPALNQGARLTTNDLHLRSERSAPFDKITVFIRVYSVVSCHFMLGGVRDTVHLVPSSHHDQAGQRLQCWTQYE